MKAVTEVTDLIVKLVNHCKLVRVGFLDDDPHIHAALVAMNKNDTERDTLLGQAVRLAYAEGKVDTKEIGPRGEEVLYLIPVEKEKVNEGC